MPAPPYVYKNLDLRFTPQDGGRYHVVLTSPAGEASGSFTPPELPAATSLVSPGSTRDLDPAGDAPPDAEAVGRALFGALFRDGLRDRLHVALALCEQEGRGLRIRLCLRDAPELSDLPWEMLYAAPPGRFLALSTATPVVRFLDLPEPPRPVEVAPPLRMLLVIARPSDLPALDVEAERARLEGALAGLVEAGVLAMERAEDGTLAGVARALRERTFHVLHFVGHGDFDEAAQDGVLAFEGDGEGRRADRVSAKKLGMLLQDHRSLRLVVLNACEGGRTGARDAFAGTAQSLARQGIPAVIAMQRPVRDEAAIVLAQELYRALAGGYPVDAALTWARQALFRDGHEGEWATAALYSRAEDGRLFAWPEGEMPRWVPEGAEGEVVCPFPGLEFFDEDRAEYFFGREGEVLEALAPRGSYGLNRGWLQVDGPSGAGKSSFARAGLVPALRARGIVGGPANVWIAVMRPGMDPVANMARALREALPSLEEALGSDEIAAKLRASQTALRGLVADHGKGRGVVLVIDQLEEVFTLAGTDKAALKHLDALLANALEDLDRPLYLVTTIRSDFTGKMGDLPRLERELATGAARYYLRTMDREGLRRAVEEPAKRAGFVWAAGLAGRIVDDAMAAGAGALPLVAHVLFAVWGKRQGRVLLAGAYDELGGVGGALARSADDIVTGLGEGGAERARGLLLRLVKIGRGTEDTRQTAAREEALAAAGGGDEAERVLARLSGGRDPGKPGGANPAVPRLVVVNGEAGRERADLVHEALIQRWDTLKRWIGEERRALELRDDVEEAARLWEANGAHADSLPKGRMLARFLGVERAGLREGAREFLAAAEAAERQAEAARRAQEERERRRARRTIAVVGAAAVVFAAAAGVAWVQTGKARAATTKAREAGRVGQGRLASALAGQAGRETEGLLLGIDAVAGGANPATATVAATEGMARGLMFVRQMVTFEGHEGAVQAVAFSPDGTRVVTGSGDHTARLWDVKDGKPFATLQGHTGDVSTVAFSPDGTRVVTASEDKTARLWDAKDGKPLATLQGHTGAVAAVAFSPDGTRVVTASEDKTARLWDAKDGKPLATLQGHTGAVAAVAFSPDGTRVMTVSQDNTARLWDAKDGKPLATLQGHADHVLAVAFSPDGTRVVTASFDNAARLWDAKDGNQLAALQDHTGLVYAVAFSPDGRRVATGSSDNTARLWDAKDGKPLAILQGHTGDVHAVAFSPDGTRVVTASLDKTARLWDAKDGKPLAILQGHTGDVHAVAFSPDGTRVVTASLDKTARLWDAKDGKPLATLQGHTDQVPAVAFSPDGTRVVTASLDKTARLWDAKDGKPLATLQGHTSIVNDVAFSPDGTRVVTASWDKTARLWDAKDGKPLATLQGHTDAVYGAAFSPDGTRVVTASNDNTAQLWDAKDGKPLVILQGHTGDVHAVAFSPDGTRVVTASLDKTARLWDAKDGKPLATLQGHTGAVYGVEFSPDGTRVVTASMDKTARLWDAKDGKPLATLQGHTDAVYGAAFSPDGTRVVTTSKDKTARLWDAKDGKPLATLQGHMNSVYAVAFSPDSTRVATGSRDNTARLWDAKTGDLLAILPGHTGTVTRVAFSPDGRHLATASEDGTVRIWAATPEGFLIQACQYLRPLPAFAEVADTCAPYLDRTP